MTPTKVAEKTKMFQAHDNSTFTNPWMRGGAGSLKMYWFEGNQVFKNIQVIQTILRLKVKKILGVNNYAKYIYSCKNVS